MNYYNLIVTIGGLSECSTYSPLVNITSYLDSRPDINYRCEIDYDPFLYMQDNNKTYGRSPNILVQTIKLNISH